MSASSALQYTDDKKEALATRTHQLWANAVKEALYKGDAHSCAGCDFLFLVKPGEDTDWRAYATLGPEHL